MSVETGDLAPNGRVGLVGCCCPQGGSFGLEPGPAEHGSQLRWALLVGFYLEGMASVVNCAGCGSRTCWTCPIRHFESAGPFPPHGGRRQADREGTHQEREGSDRPARRHPRPTRPPLVWRQATRGSALRGSPGRVDQPQQLAPVGALVTDISGPPAPRSSAHRGDGLAGGRGGREDRAGLTLPCQRRIDPQSLRPPHGHRRRPGGNRTNQSGTRGHQAQATTKDGKRP
jgi:hypothetical protein